MAAAARWVLPRADARKVESLAGALEISLPAARVLWQRGYRDRASAREFLAPSLDDLHSPSLLTGMREAVGRLRRAIDAEERILLYGDYDVDGSTSVVILKKAIELAGGKATFHIPHRLHEGYGMREEVIERAAAEGVRLVISVDTGIRASEVVRRAAELGIDVIVTDHHLPEAELPPAVAILNPNRPDCAYPDKNLCGAGVAFKLVSALLETLSWPEGKKRRMAASFLKLVAIATVADVVPLTGENRIIVKHGLAGLRQVRNPGLRALLSVAGFVEGASPSAGQVAFRIAPRINAAGRMAHADDVIRLFLTDREEEAQRLASQLHSLNQERQQAEAEIVQAILEECSRVPVTDDQAALVLCGENWHRGVVGIVASRLVERFHRPAFVLSVDPARGEAEGSGRSAAGFHLLEALETMPELFTRFGGHRQAAGLALPVARLAEFRERLNAYAASRLSPEDFRPTREFDAALDFGEINDRAVAEVLALAPFGFGNPAPLFAVEGAEVAGSPVLWKEKHLRVRLRQGSRFIWVKAWNFAERLGELTPGSVVDVALNFEEDSYTQSRGYPGWGVVLRDVRGSGAGG